jgi:3-methyladenine DNA glycosylase AlkC
MIDPLGLSRTSGTGSTVTRMASEGTSTRAPLSERLAIALGRPAPRDLTADELADLEARQDAADREAERLYGVRGQAAA